MGNDRYRDLLMSAQCRGPLIFKPAVCATIEVRVLGEMVERVRRAVEARGDIVTAVIGRSPIRTAGSGLRLARPGGRIGLG